MAVATRPEIGSYYSEGSALVRVVDVVTDESAGVLLEDAVTGERVWREGVEGLVFRRGPHRTDTAE